jgi:hypothetical protein
MQAKLLRISLVLALGLGLMLTPSVCAQQNQFSADMQLRNGTDHTDTVRLYVGNQRARFDRVGSLNDNRISTLIIDFYHQMIYLVVPEARVYMRIAGSEGMPFYDAARMFRPLSPDQPCGQWIWEADRRRIALKCQPGEVQMVDGRTMQKWEASSAHGARGFLWYDRDLNFIVRVARISQDGVQSGYELLNIKPGFQPQDLFNPHAQYRPFALNNLIDVLTGVSQW